MTFCLFFLERISHVDVPVSSVPIKLSGIDDPIMQYRNVWSYCSYFSCPVDRLERDAVASVPACIYILISKRNQVFVSATGWAESTDIVVRD